MTPLSDILLSLADRVEAATSADQELDCLIWCALNGVSEIFYPEGSGRVEATGADGKRQLLGWIDPGEVARNFTPYGGDTAYPNVTASLDASLTLVPEGSFIRKLIQFGVDGPWGAVIAYAGKLHMPEPVSVAATPALALTAACLRARAAESDQS